MATENNSSENSVQLSGKNCSLCLENSELKEAEKFCVDCGSYLCEQCLKYHNKFPLLRAHHIVDNSVDTQKEGVQGAQHELVSERCAVHHGQIIDNYCKDHDEICCGVCVTIKHRSCVNIGSINEAAKGVHESKELKETKESLHELMSRIKLEKDKRNNNVTALDQEKVAILKEIDEFEDDIVKRVKELADASREEVRSKHSKLLTAVKADVSELETVITMVEGSLKILNSCDRNEPQTFVNNKNSEKVVQEAEMLVGDLPSKWPIRKLEYCFDYEPPYKVTCLKTFGHFTEDTDIQLNALYLSERYKGEIHVKLNNDIKDCIVSGICFLDNGTFAVTDCANRKLKRLNRKYELCDSIKLDGGPASSCISGPQEVAAAFCNQKRVQFVSCGEKLSLGDSFDTKIGCEGIFFDLTCDELYVCGSSAVCIYKKNGTLLRTIENSETEELLFSGAKHCVMVPGSNTIYVADWPKGLTALTKNGKIVWTFKDENLEKPWGVCQVSDNQLLVAGSISRNILQVGADGKKVCELLKVEERLSKLYTVVYDRRNSRIMVGGIGNDIFIYSLCRK